MANSTPSILSGTRDREYTVKLISDLRPYKTSGEMIDCALSALAHGLAGLTHFDCGYQFRLHVYQINDELQGFFESDKFEPYARQKLGDFFEPGLTEYDKDSASETCRDKSAIVKSHLLALHEYFTEKYFSDSKPELILIIFDARIHEGKSCAVMAQVHADARRSDEPIKYEKAVVVHNIYGHADGGHWEGFAPVICGFENDISLDGLPTEVTPFILVTDPRYNHGSISPIHRCNPDEDEPCSEEDVMEFFETNGFDVMKPPPEASAPGNSLIDELTDDEIQNLGPDYVASLFKLGMMEAFGKLSAGNDDDEDASSDDEEGYFPGGGRCSCRSDGEGASSDEDEENNNRDTKKDADGLPLAEFALIHYRDHCSKNGALTTYPKPDIHPLEWLLDFWDEYQKEALNKVMALGIGGPMKYTGIGAPALSKPLQQLIMEEAGRIRAAQVTKQASKVVKFSGMETAKEMEKLEPRSLTGNVMRPQTSKLLCHEVSF